MSRIAIVFYSLVMRRPPGADFWRPGDLSPSGMK